MGNKNIIIYKMYGGLLILVVAFTWEISSRVGIINSIFFPPLTIIINELWNSILSMELLIASGITLGRCMSGYLIAIIIAIPVGISMGISTKVYHVLEPFVELLRPIPSAAMIPIAIIFLGIDEPMKIAVIVYGSMWPILLNTINGVQTIDSILIDTGRIFRHRGISFLLKITVPAALPSIYTGLRISMAISLILTITVEMLVGNSGIGYLIIDYERGFKYPQMYSGIITLGIIGYLINSVFLLVENKLFAWAKYEMKY